MKYTDREPSSTSTHLHKDDTTLDIRSSSSDTKIFHYSPSDIAILIPITIFKQNSIPIEILMAWHPLSLV
ncbi:hypothetical protein L1887_08903 [Cichorium endivia]|nr:hypothetical protein L1887_08903 [Cichorium endivia]